MIRHRDRGPNHCEGGVAVCVMRVWQSESTKKKARGSSALTRCQQDPHSSNPALGNETADVSKLRQKKKTGAQWPDRCSGYSLL